MRSFRHWTPRYIFNRICEELYMRSCPDLPWLTKSANAILQTYLKPGDQGLEFGSGRSTIWFAKHVGRLTSVEHDKIWHEKVRTMISDNGLTNIDYHLFPKDVEDEKGAEAAYVRVIDTFDPESFDFVLVDGVYRDHCCDSVLDKIRPGGVLIIDNVNWYLPCQSFSPNSRTFDEGPDGEIWIRVSEALSEWRLIWTSSGVTDTAFFFKPCDNA